MISKLIVAKHHLIIYLLFHSLFYGGEKAEL